ncbi:MAG: IPT/TIG domain-containing protein [Candidatus Marinimicrobia bacterium]|nr:IPT/TIG domain-containing protein [Candidatus Neomarinimicrobiota bacterium]MCF7922561.1 IPT/TIG domain-containing protein [Candidatus Neomarinimicrobiota bacterium]
MKRLIKFSLVISTLLSVLACTEESSSWVDPNPTGGPAPVITNVSPDSGFAGTVAIITGENFATTLEDNMVLFGSIPAVVKEASSTELTVQLPMINDKTVLPKVAVKGSEFWGYWEGQTPDTAGVLHDDSLTFTFYQALEALTDTVYWPAGVVTAPDSTIYFIVNQADAGWSKGLHKVNTDGSVEVVRTSTILGNLIYDAASDSIWGSNLRRGRDLGWISRAPSDGSGSFSKMIKDVVTPSSIEFDQSTGDMYFSSLGFYEVVITPVEDRFDTTITDIKGGIYLEPMSNRTFSDTSLATMLMEYSRPTSCKIMDGYLYVTQAYQETGAAISRNQIIGNTLGETEVVLDEFDNVYCLEFDSDGNLYFVPEGSSTLYQYNQDTGSLVEFFPGDVVPTANFMSWSGINLVIVYSNVADDMEVTAAEAPGMIQRVYVGSTGYSQ